jgi:Lrp/AsnC family transcriptional regulator, leucine-responsive regulatory protein
MDKLDVKLLCALVRDSRTHLSKLAKHLKISREVVNYRINRLQKQGILQSFVTEINIGKLGYQGAAVFITVKSNAQKEFKEYLLQTSFVSWVAELAGVWSFGLSIIGKSNEEIDHRFSTIYKKFKNTIIDHRITPHRKSNFYYEKYFGKKTRTTIIENLIDYKIDNKDLDILQILSTNSRAETTKISRRVKLTAPAVAKRITKLTKAGIIEKFSIFVDTSKIGLYLYSIFVINKNIDQEEKLLSYLKEHPSVVFSAEYVGDPFIELGIFVNNPYLLREKLQEIEEKFPDSRIMEVSLFQREFISIGPPKCVFE